MIFSSESEFFHIKTCELRSIHTITLHCIVALHTDFDVPVRLDLISTFNLNAEL